MFFNIALLLPLFGLTTILAAPTEHRLEDIQCRCLSFSTSAKPTLCTYLESYGLDWQTAYTLAIDNDLKIQFASQATISEVLSIPKPLPTSMLESINEGEAMPLETEELITSENMIICGFGDEAKHMDSHDKLLEPELHYVGMVAGGVMMFLIIYMVGEYLWTRYITRRGTIKLEGEEKALYAGLDRVDCAAPSDFS